MSDGAVDQPSVPTARSTIGEVLRDVMPMGALGRLVINDLGPEEEDVFYRVLEGA